jgi:hypothetical protein
MKLKLIYGLLAFIFSLSGCATNPGIDENNRQFFTNVQTVTLPFKILLDEKSRTLQQGTMLEPRDFSNHVGPGLQGALSQGLLSLTHEIRRANSEKEKFLVGEVLDSALKTISYPGPKDTPTINIKIVHFQPVLSKGAFQKTGLYMNLTFNASFNSFNKITQSYYTFDYYGSDISSEKDALLREMINFATKHWANEFLAHAAAKDVIPEFPPKKRGYLEVNQTTCKYELFRLLD